MVDARHGDIQKRSPPKERSPARGSENLSFPILRQSPQKHKAKRGAAGGEFGGLSAPFFGQKREPAVSRRLCPVDNTCKRQKIKVHWTRTSLSPPRGIYAKNRGKTKLTSPGGCARI
ncbi:hypothetical protein HMPREF0262_02927 [Clostridium sp. ATCC 29733]|nr:hypothetical protein HMPREF0262_02927 [Clostridium sp. ATCC 29733]